MPSRQHTIVISLAALSCVAAAHPGAHLVVTDAHGCLDAQTLRAAVERRIGRPVFTDGAANTQVRVDLTEHEGRRSAHVTVDDRAAGASGTRTIDLSPGGCDEAREAVALIVAVAIGGPLRAPDPPPPPPPVPVPRRSMFAIGLGAIVTAATSPGPAFGGIGRAAVAPLPRLRIELTAGATAPVTRTIDAQSARFTTMLFDLGVCPTFGGSEHTRVAMRACATLGIDGVHAKGTGFDVERTSMRWIPRAGLGLGGFVRLGAGFHLRLDARADLPLTRRSWVYDVPGDDARSVWSTPPVGATVALTIERALP